MSSLRRLLPLLLVFAGASLAACVKRDPVETLIRDIVAEAEDRDAAGVGELLTADFTGGDGSDRESVLRTARQFLAAYRSLDADVSAIEINRRGSSARAKFRVKLTGVPTSFGGIGDLVPKQAAFDFDVTAREEDGDWKLASATWTEIPD
jgi:hypothetical protein